MMKYALERNHYRKQGKLINEELSISECPGCNEEEDQDNVIKYEAIQQMKEVC